MAAKQKAQEPEATATPATAGETAPSAPTWLGELEVRVHQAAREIASLRDRNAALAARIEGLEGDLAAERTARRVAEEAVAEARAAVAAAEARAAEARASAPAPGGAVPPAAAAVWESERREIRERVERLVGTLETLLAEAADAPLGVQATLEG